MANHLQTLSVALIALTVPLTIGAQEPSPTPKPVVEKPAGAAVKSGITPTRLQFVISRYQGEKKISSVPYSLSVNIGGPRAGLRMGAQVPYATTQATDGGKIPSYSYRDVGIGIDVTNQTYIEPGLYRFDIIVEDTSISSNNQVQGAPAINAVPVFRTFRTNTSILVKDGQTTPLTTAADPISGEVMRVDVTFSLVK